jgi:hypothetical protein
MMFAVPTPTTVTVVPETVATLGLPLANATGAPDVVVATS